MGTQSARHAAPSVFSPGRMAAVAVLSAVFSMAGFAFLVSPATAKPEYLQGFNKKYGTQGTKLDSCNTCHTTTQDADHLNPYGIDFRKADHDYGAIEGLDSDGDGFKNIDEINAGTFPGDPNDNPDTKAKPKPAPTTTTTKPFPFSLLGNVVKP
ncbi:MAG TPA: thrombospondin type 3 repeat-containing protein [Acidimicrobiia bacterium]